MRSFPLFTNTFPSLKVSGLFWMLLLLLYAPIASAQSQDSVPPQITHQLPVTPASAGSDYLFLAFIIDNESVSEAFVNFRLSGDSEFQRRQMKEEPGALGNYSYTLPGRMVEAPGIEYFITASDPSGNEQTRGFAFDPLVINVSPVVPIASSSKSVNPLYYVIGAVVIGGVVAALASGGDDNGESKAIPFVLGVQ